MWLSLSLLTPCPVCLPSATHAPPCNTHPTHTALTNTPHEQHAPHMHIHTKHTLTPPAVHSCRTLHTHSPPLLPLSPRSLHAHHAHSLHHAQSMQHTHFPFSHTRAVFIPPTPYACSLCYTHSSVLTNSLPVPHAHPPTPRALTCTLCTLTPCTLTPHSAYVHPKPRTLCHALCTPFAHSPNSSCTHPCPWPPALCALPDPLAPCTLTSHPVHQRLRTRPPHPSRPARSPRTLPHPARLTPAPRTLFPAPCPLPPRLPLPPRQAACDTPPPLPAATLSAPSFPRGLLSGRVGTRAPGAE